MNLFGRVTGGDIRELREAIEQVDARVTSNRDQIRKHHGRMASIEKGLRELREMLTALASGAASSVDEEEEEE